MGAVRLPEFLMKKSLPSSEWILVLSLMVVMGALVFISKVNVYRYASSLIQVEESQEMILVRISGAVTKPGEYLVPAGMRVVDVLKKSRPKPWADLAGVSPKELVESPLDIKVKELAEITVTVCGAVTKPQEITLSARSRLSDLKSKISFEKDADKSVFRRRRVLRNGEKIDVPKKTVE
ncbi:MAG: hypothetical protein COT85_04800 [Chlamydiae bacterium CG10_big_fil_rev_8_21_14_0_10_42_34]|nr:MAG: hypothetical protein COT85_04800 [Chlamydiae bacterium CG10_big_fil_rev_8_21_14_0_10_42_34]